LRAHFRRQFIECLIGGSGVLRYYPKPIFRQRLDNVAR
jgi:hypothetical protein